MSLFDAPWLQELWSRLAPERDPVVIASQTLVIVLVLTAVVVFVPVIWRRFRIVVTLVHELGHAVAGMLVGRKFTGFVLRGDMSGHAVTVGRPTGFGRVFTTWAGYPAPAIIGALLGWLGARGWAAPVLTALLAILLIAVWRVRSWLTALVMILAIAAVGALWWWRNDALQAPVLLGIGTVLVVGAWRHLAAVWGSHNASSDPAVLAQLTRVPAFLWNLSFAIVCALATWAVGAEFASVLELRLPTAAAARR